MLGIALRSRPPVTVACWPAERSIQSPRTHALPRAARDRYVDREGDSAYPLPNKKSIPAS
jgi:hypothetical protein